MAATGLTRTHVTRLAVMSAAAATLAGCTVVPRMWPAEEPPVVKPPVTVPSGTVLPQPDGQGGLLRPKAHWTPATFNDLPGWDKDRFSEWWPALWQSCQRPAPGWTATCNEVRELGPQWGQRVSDDFVRQWLESHLQPWRIKSLEGQSNGLLTGYFEPLLDGKRKPDARFRYPLYRTPADYGQRKPYYTRAEIDTLPEAKAALTGRELVYLADPLDVLLIQVQGSGRIRLQDELTPQGQPRVVRMAFAGHNDQPYQSVARWLVDQGALTMDQASWQAVRNWANQNPQRVPELVRANPRVIFFKEDTQTDASVGPNGAQGVPLTAGRSVAVDKDAVPLGAALWIDSTVPQPWSLTPAVPQPLQRIVMAQDTGSAIQGAVRADFFWGAGDDALAQAGRTKQPLSAWVLWPVNGSAR